jgi:hypothetical protein
MFSTHRGATVAALVALVALTGALGVSTVAATPQSDLAPNNSTTTTTADDDGRNVSIQVDGQTWVADYGYANGEFEVTLVTTAALRTVTISEAVGGDKGGSGYFSVRQVRLMPGQPTTVSIPAEQVDGKAVITLTTGQCIQTGKCPYLQAGSGESTVFDGSAQWNFVYIAAGGTFIGAAFGTRRYVRKNTTDDDDRIVRGVFDDE